MNFYVFIVFISTAFNALKADHTHPKYVTLVTTMGDIKLELFWDSAPKTCENFVELGKRGYYDNVIFHRVIKNFMIQGGDPTGTGRGGQSIYGKKFQDEFDPRLSMDGPGYLSMANAGPDTNGSQFFITLRECKYLNGKHTIFGKVVGQTLKTVLKIGDVKTIKDKPVVPVKIESVQIEE